MDALAELTRLEAADSFIARHIGPDAADIAAMLERIGAASLDDLADRAVPAAIRDRTPLDLPPAADEAAVLAELAGLASRNRVLRSLIGQGYHGTHMPAVIRRNVLENPAWYTAYTPYQPEISQGRLEALLVFQTMVTDLTAMPIANASLLDEATAVAEAVAMARSLARGTEGSILVATDLHPQTRAVLATRAHPLGLVLVDVAPGDVSAIRAARPAALVLQYPGTAGALRDLSAEIAAVREGGGLAIVAADLLGLALLKPPGEMGADASACRWASAARMRRSLPRARCSSARCRGGWWACRSTPPATRPCGWRCKPASSISAARRRPPTSAPRRFCWPISPPSMPCGTGPMGFPALPRACISRPGCWPMPRVAPGCTCAMRHSSTALPLKRTPPMT